MRLFNHVLNLLDRRRSKLNEVSTNTEAPFSYGPAVNCIIVFIVLEQ